VDIHITTLIVITVAVTTIFLVIISIMKLATVSTVEGRGDVANMSTAGTLETLHAYLPKARMLGLMSLITIFPAVVIQVENFFLINAITWMDPGELNWFGYVQVGIWTVSMSFLGAFLITTIIQAWTCFTLVNACCGRKLVQLNASFVFSMIFYAWYIIIAVVFNIPYLGEDSFAELEMSLSALSGAPFVVLILAITRIKERLRMAGFADICRPVEVAIFIQNKWQDKGHVELDELARAFNLRIPYAEARLKFYMKRGLLQGIYNTTTRRFNFPQKITVDVEKEIDTLDAQFSQWNDRSKGKNGKI
jgi:hypothetical protein